MDTTLWLLVAAVLGNGLLVGASLDQTIKQLPTRRRGTAHPGCCGRRAPRPARGANRRGPVAGAGADRGALAGPGRGGAARLTLTELAVL
ncbi:MAG: hypothetical protein ACJ75K_17540, partial [Actinomycetes bacterium]